MLKKKTKFIISILAITFLVFLLYVLYMLTKQPMSFWDKIVYSGFIPRVVAWVFLISAVYGLSRRRFSPLVVFFFFMISFFFAYIGKFLIPEIY